MIALLAFFVSAFAQVVPAGNELMERADRAYREGHLGAAHELWVSALRDPDVAEGPVLFNLGNCAFRRGQVPEALLWWHRSRLRSPRDPEIAFNVRLAEQELGLPPAPRAWSDRLTQRELLALVVLLQAGGLLGFLFQRRRAAKVACAALVLATLPGVVALLRDPWRSVREGIVLTSSAALRPEPHAELTTLGTVPAGALVRIVEMSDRWAHVESEAGRGWIARPAVGIVE